MRKALHTGAFWAMVLGGMVLNDAADTTVNGITPVMTVAMPVLAILLTFGMGVAAGKIPPRKILSVGLIIGALGHLVLLLMDGGVGAVVFLSAVAVVQGGSAVYWIMAGDYFGRSKFASLMGLLLLLRAVVAFVPSVIVGLLERNGAHYEISLIFYILVYAAAGVALWFARRTFPATPGVRRGAEGSLRAGTQISFAPQASRRSSQMDHRSSLHRLHSTGLEEACVAFLGNGPGPVQASSRAGPEVSEPRTP